MLWVGWHMVSFTLTDELWSNRLSVEMMTSTVYQIIASQNMGSVFPIPPRNVRIRRHAVIGRAAQVVSGMCLLSMSQERDYSDYRLVHQRLGPVTRSVTLRVGDVPKFAGDQLGKHVKTMLVAPPQVSGMHLPLLKTFF